jgi:uncharacterized protein (DUF362 family)
MKKNKHVKYNVSHVSNSSQGANTISRRKVIKRLILAPIQFALFLPLLKARELTGTFPVEKKIPGNIYPGTAGSLVDDLFTPNKPVGKGQGIVPGRVSWVWNPEATNPGCANQPLSNEITENKYDAWFMDKNTNQEMVDGMLAAGICSTADKKDTGEAWDAIFRYHNKKRGKGNFTYAKGEKIYLKLNRTTASSGITPDYERRKDRALTLACETSPQVVLAMLRQLVNVAGVPQQAIYVGDAMRNIYQDEYLKYHAEFPEVNYLSSFGNTGGRIKSSESSKDLIFYSDKKAVMDSAGSDKFYAVLEEAEYLICLPSMKGHNLAGFTLCTKNHFGTQTRRSASHLHPGLNNSSRQGYGYYRVLVDMMGNKHTGEKNLFYMLDALWSGNNWNGLPVKFLMPPFNNHWCSSLFMSLDPVAIESVGLDFLRTEFTNPEHTVAYISDPGVDDYLHQAADSKNWPTGIVYAPNGDGISLPASLEAHEHWNNPEDKQYARNLGKAEGIELVKIFQKG